MSDCVEVNCIRVMVADDDENVRLGLELFVEVYDDLIMVAEAENGQQAVQLASELHPDVVIMDMKMPVMDGITATRLIHEQYPDIQVIMISAYLDQAQIASALQAGAFVYLPKTISTDQLAESIRAANDARMPH